MKKMLAALATTVLSWSALAAYPEKPVTIVVPFAAGGPTDKVARDLGVVLSKHLNNQTVVIENVGGAGGTLGAARVAKAAPDGYTLLLHHIGMATSPALYRKMPYDTLGDFQSISLVGDVPLVILANPALPVRNLKELVTLVKQQPGKMSYASFGMGSMSHLGGALLMDMLGLKMIHVPYKGGGPAMTDLIGGHVPLFFASSATAPEPVKAGRARALAIASASRSPLLPTVPSVNEALGIKGYEATIMYGVFTPAKVSPDIVRRLSEVTGKVLRAPDIVARLQAQGMAAPAPGTPEQMTAYIKENLPLWAKVIREANIRID